MYIPERQLQNSKFILGEIGKVFSYHSEMVMKERGVLVRDIQNEANWTQYEMKLQVATSHNNNGPFQEGLSKSKDI
jgi:hypothetical protein